MQGLNDTIAAIATASGASGLAVVRVSGPAALEVAAAVFRGACLDEAPSHTLHHGWVEWPAAGRGVVAAPAARARAVADSSARANGAGAFDPASGGEHVDVIPISVAAAGAGAASERIDEVVAAIFRAPRSYTREDVVEISCHGGRLTAARVLEALRLAGARLAAPGEFTLRAFLNGRLDLVQAEAVADLIHAESEAARSLALGQLAGEPSRRLAAVRERLADLLAEVEARVDFAEDVGGVEIPPRALGELASARDALGALLDGAAFARAVREGVRVPIAGRPNVGKSSLFNALVGEPRVIVTPEPGTTRDRVSEPIEIAGVRVLLSDTAGLREAEGPIEAEGVARSREIVAQSPLVLWVVDASNPLEPDDLAIAASLGRGAEHATAPGANGGAKAARAGDLPTSGALPIPRKVVVVLNKRDLGARVDAAVVRAALAAAPAATVKVSARTGVGLDALRSALAAALGADHPGSGAALSNPRHAEALERARASLDRASAAARAGEPGEIVALELRESLAAIGEVTGEAVGEDLLERIFARFCVGK